MPKLKIILVLVVQASLAGCASNAYKAPPYHADHSRAYNITNAGRINNGIRDAKVPKDSVGTFTSSWTYGALSTAAGGLRTVQGPGILNGWAGAGIGLVTWLLAPDEPADRITLFAWMPQSEAATPEAARLALMDRSGQVMMEALGELGYEHDKSVYVTKNKKIAAIAFWGNGTKCGQVIDGKKRVCVILMQSYEATPGNAPTFLQDGGGDTDSNMGGDTGAAPIPSYAFTLHGKSPTKYSYLRVKAPKEAGVDEAAIYNALSRRLPTWVYLYLPPKKVRAADGTLIPYPVVLEKGKPLLFVVPE